MTFRPPSARLAVMVALAAAVLGAGCGDQGPQDRKLTPGEAARLRAHLSGVRQAAARQDPKAARAKLRAFRRDVRRLAAGKALTSAEQRQLADGALQAEARADLELSAPPPDEEQSPVPDPNAAPSTQGEGEAEEGKEDKEDKGKDKGGKDHGEDGEEGGDD